MLTSICPKLPMRNKAATQTFYTEKLGFKVLGTTDFEDYLIVKKREIEIHFFAFEALDPLQNYGQVYIRTNAIEAEYASLIKAGTNIHANGDLAIKPWGQIEFSVLDPDNNLLTFGQEII